MKTIKIRPNKDSNDIYEYNVYQDTGKALNLRISDKNVPQTMVDYFWVISKALSLRDDVYEIDDWFWKYASKSAILSLGRDDLLNNVNFNS